MEYKTKTKDEIVGELDVDPDKGLSSEQVEALQQMSVCWKQIIYKQKNPLADCCIVNISHYCNS